jgi:hypothetical protein
MAATDLAVRIATIFDSTGLKKADKGFSKLEKNAKSLGKSLGLALSTAAVVAYGKAAVKAFAEDEAAAQRLAVAVKNIGLSLFTQDVEDFIAKTESSAAILDDKLRPAMQALLTTTGSFTKSQELLNNAITISRASGVDLATVSQDLANGYVGITKGLKKYNTGLTQTELKTKSFSEVLGILLTNSAGAAEAYLGTTSYKLEALGVAASNAQEKIGMGLMDALAKLSGGTTTADAIKTIDNIASGINAITSAVAGAIGSLVKLYGWFDRTAKAISENYPDPFGVRDDKPKYKSPRMSSPAGTWARTKQQREAEAAAAKRAKELAALQKKQVAATKALTAEQKKQAALKKAGTMFDLEQIGIIAALKGNISEEERLRLKLQLALITENDKEASALTLKLAQAQGLSKDLSAYLADLPAAKNPFASWSAYLDMIIEKARLAAAFGGSGGSSQRDLTSLTPTVSALVTGAVTGGAGSTSAGDVYITVNGSVLSEQDLVSAVQNGLNYNALAGKRSDIGRIAGMFG